MLSSLASSLLNKWEWHILKPMVTPSWSLIRLKEYEVQQEDLILYHHAAIQLANKFDDFYINYVSRLQNTTQMLDVQIRMTSVPIVNK